MSIYRLINADSSRNLLSKVLQTQLGNCGILCSCEQLVWLTSGFKASGANVVISSASNKRLRLMEWMAKMAWPCAWLLWPDQEKNEQRAELIDLDSVVPKVLRKCLWVQTWCRQE